MSTTLLDIRDDVRVMLGDTHATNKSYSDDLLNNLINKECRNIHNYLARNDRTYKQEHNTYTAITDAVAGTSNERYTLPATFYSFVGAVWIDGDTEYSIEPYDKIKAGTRWNTTGRPLYIYFKGNEFGLISRPSTANTIRFMFIPKYVVLSADADVLQVPDDYISLPQLYATYMAMQLKGKHLKNSYDIERAYRKEKADFLIYASSRGFIKKTREAFGSGYGADYILY